MYFSHFITRVQKIMRGYLLRKYNNTQEAWGNWTIEKTGNNWIVKGDKGADYFSNYLQPFSNSFSSIVLPLAQFNKKTPFFIKGNSICPRISSSPLACIIIKSD